jgi:tRNA nucleotidyltransferase (CCA-adding enzyme)
MPAASRKPETAGVYRRYTSFRNRRAPPAHAARARSPGLQEVLDSVLRRVTPTETERKETKEALEAAKRATEAVIGPMGLSYTVAGSFVRDTWLPDKKEFDIFILFPASEERSALEKKGLAIGKDVMRRLGGKHVVAYAEHPYVRGTLGKFHIDIVPCFAVKSAAEMKSSVDRTPFHNKWLEGNFPAALAPDTRLLKRFAKGIGVYGADTKTLGLSGYLCELLMVRYRTFERFLSEASLWEAGKVVIDPAGHKTPPGRFRGEPLIVIDPVDPGRNVASALSPANFLRVVALSGRLLKMPSLSLFFPPERRPGLPGLRALLRAKGTRLVGVSFATPAVLDDIFWPQLRKSAARLEAMMEDSGFRVMGSGAFSDGKTSLLLLEMEVWELPAIRKVRGPHVFSSTNMDNFLRKYGKSSRIWAEGECLVAENRRPFRRAEDALRAALAGKEHDLRERGMASHVAGQLARRHSVLDGPGVFSLAARSPAMARFLDAFFRDRLF